MQKVSVSELVEDFGFYPRMDVSDIYVSELAEALRSGAALPPIIADKASKRIVDGFHRTRAHRRIFGDKARISVKWKEYANEAEMFADAVRLNADHGRRLNRKEIVRCIHLAEQHNWLTTEQIASLTGLTTEKLEKLIADRTGWDKESGEPVVLGSGFNHLAGHHLTRLQQKAARRSYGNVLYYAERLAELLEANALPLDDEKLVSNLFRLQTALNRMFPK